MSGWDVRLSAAAEQDFRIIVDWTAARFGPAQARAYAETLMAGVEALGDGPEILGVRARDDVRDGILTLRVGRHLLAFQVAHDHKAVEILRILHDGMDLPRHLPTARP